MEIKEKVKCLIIGSGPAGYTAAIYAARAGIIPTLYTGMQPGGQLTITNDVENYPGYPDGVMGPKMMQDFEAQAKRFGTIVNTGIITQANFSEDGGIHSVVVDNKFIVEAETVIISTGASAKWLGLESEKRLNGRGVSACAVCDGFFFKNQDVAIVGGGDTACEEASYLSKLCKKIYMIVRKDEFRASKIMQERVKKNPKIEIIWNSETKEILGKEDVEGVLLKNLITGEEQTIVVTGFFVAIGHKPNTDIFKGQIDLDENGYIETIKGSTKTNLEGIFACGDDQDHVYRQAVTAAGTGCMAALDAERYLISKEVYA